MRAMTRAVVVDIEVHWGYSVREPMYTASQPSYRLPPQTTMIGALAYPYAKTNKIPECITLSGALYSSATRIAGLIKWVTVKNPLGPLGPIATNDISRLLLVLGVRREHIYRGSRFIWGVQPVGKIYAPSTVFRAVYIVEDGKAADIARMAYSIVRMGSRESLVDVKKVVVSRIIRVKKRPVTTLYYFPSRLAREVRGIYFRENMLTPFSDYYKLGAIRNSWRYTEEYIIPRNPVDVEPSSNAEAVAIEETGEQIIVPVEVVE